MNIILCTGSNSSIISKEVSFHLKKENITNVNVIPLETLRKFPKELHSKEKILVILSDFGLDTSLNFLQLEELLVNNPYVPFIFITKEERENTVFENSNITVCKTDSITLSHIITLVENFYLENSM